MTNKEIIKIAMHQSAIDSNCCMEDFISTKNKIVISDKSPNARRYLELPFYCDLTSYGNNIVASVSEELVETVSEYIEKYPVEHCFETPNLLQSILFGMLHGIMFISLVGVLKAILVVIFTGAIAGFMGYVNEKKANGSIYPSWMIHGVSNTFSALISMFSII